MIKCGAPSKRSPITEAQARLMAQAIWSLAQATARHVPSTGEEMTIAEYQRFATLAEYGAFMDVALACGFVCADLTHDFPFEKVHQQPDAHLRTCSFNRLRHYIHALQRTEKWHSEYSTALYAAVTSKALNIVAERLTEDLSLRVSLIDERT